MRWIKDFGAVVAIVLAVIGGAVAYGALGQRVTNVEATSAETKDRTTRNEQKLGEHDTGIAVLNAKTDAVLQALDRLENKVGSKR